jgi:hypothetical protein
VRTFWVDAGEMAAEVSETASADMQFHGENPDERQARPLPKAEASEQLFACVLQRGLYAVDRGKWQVTNLFLTSAP